ncbi:MAG: hypothetical protein IOC64_13525 [Methylobacterium sp.]|jgi:hypothetical protein|nr:hypothetical protein [Methylobacterium sp.]MCA3605976.1 hypothetical protein [Methylobacterium sp.]MCA3608228.1 hypothetical protein [Methylobacterium sp.]MCA3612376.1 hypothetical protein [Methylobacterium sp.]MCA3616952.1 hypothetical protein [Methylobacterium sp.]
MPLKSLKLPSDISAEIEKMAEEAGVTAEKQAEILLRYSLGNFPRRETLLEAAVRIAAMTPPGVKQVPAEILVREARDQ